MLCLQKILFPTVLDSTVQLYYRADNALCFDAALNARVIHTSMRFDTYFNMFSLRTWREYTYVDAVTLTIRQRGSCRIRLYGLHADNQEELLAEHDLENAGMTASMLPFPATDARMLFWTLERGENFAFEEAWYATDIASEKQRNIRIAVVICTFRREAHVRRTMRLLREAWRTYPDLQGRLRVHIVDNGRTLDAEKFAREDVFLYPNPNVGGTGGFTRGMIEVLDRDDGATHFLLMDDDVEVLPESFFRTLRLLELCREEYRGAFLGGAMLDARQRHRQYERAAAIHAENLVLHNVQGNFDLRERGLCLANDVTEHGENRYQGWWWCVFPVETLADRGLPYPFFVRLDDIEYALRKATTIIYLNGICLWHEPFYVKNASSMLYQHHRNMWILCALRFSARTELRMLAPHWGKWFLAAVLHADYARAEALGDMLRDFSRGPDILRDPSLGELIVQNGRGYMESFLPLETISGIAIPANLEALYGPRRLCGLKRLAALLTVNGNLLPACCRRDGVGFVLTDGPIRIGDAFLRKQVLVINPYERTGALRTFSCRKFLTVCMHNVWAWLHYLVKRRKARAAFRREYPRMTSMRFWRAYLGMRIHDHDR